MIKWLSQCLIQLGTYRWKALIVEFAHHFNGGGIRTILVIPFKSSSHGETFVVIVIHNVLGNRVQVEQFQRQLLRWWVKPVKLIWAVQASHACARLWCTWKTWNRLLVLEWIKSIRLLTLLFTFCNSTSNCTEEKIYDCV